MPQLLALRPELASALAVLLLLGGVQAARSRQGPTRIRTDADRQFIQCGTALALLHQDRGSDAVALLKSHSHTPLPLPQETTLSSELAPGTQVLQLSQNLTRAAQIARERGHPSEAHAYLEQCRALSRRIRTGADDELTLQVAQSVDSMTKRTKETLGL
jgi:hypothetical protein